MTGYGRTTLLAMLAMPVVAAIAVKVTPAMDAVTPRVAGVVFGLNLIPMLIGGAMTARLLQRSRRAGGAGSGMAVTPVVIPALLAALDYAYRAVIPDPVAPGVEYLRDPEYLLVAVTVIGVLASIGCAIARRGRTAAVR